MGTSKILYVVYVGHDSTRGSEVETFGLSGLFYIKIDLTLLHLGT